MSRSVRETSGGCGSRWTPDIRGSSTRRGAPSLHWYPGTASTSAGDRTAAASTSRCTGNSGPRISRSRPRTEASPARSGYTAWQAALLATNHEAFLRGLIHSDGCRFVAHEVKAGHRRDAVRYAFANRSDDIKDLFCRSCDALGVRWTRSEKQVSIYRKASVAILDGFIGPKC